jgi:hypothetical protein
VLTPAPRTARVLTRRNEHQPESSTCPTQRLMHSAPAPLRFHSLPLAHGSSRSFFSKLPIGPGSSGHHSQNRELSGPTPSFRQLPGPFPFFCHRLPPVRDLHVLESVIVSARSLSLDASLKFGFWSLNVNAAGQSPRQTFDRYAPEPKSPAPQPSVSQYSILHSSE